jgi:Uma2 family endonuclease
MDVLPGEDELPYDFGEQMESDLHRSGMFLLIETLQLHVAARQDIYVAGNMAIYFSARQVKSNDFLGPDVMVIRGTTLRKRKSWVCWHEERTPSVVIELLSESTEDRDRNDKMAIYATVLRTPEYFLFDPIDGRLEGYRLDPAAQAYAPIPADPAGLLAVEQLGLLLGVLWDESDPEWHKPALRWHRPDGARVPNRQEIAASALEEKRTAQESERIAQEEKRIAQARAARLAEKLRALGLDPDDL